MVLKYLFSYFLKSKSLQEARTRVLSYDLQLLFVKKVLYNMSYREFKLEN